MPVNRRALCAVLFSLAAFLGGCGGGAHSIPAPLTYTLIVNSTNPASGVSIGVSPADNSSAGNGSTSFTRTYNSGTSVTLTAPATSGANTFSSWTGCSTTSAATCTVTLSTNTTVTANYMTPSQTTYTLTVDSTDPASGVAIGASPADNNNTTTGDTSFTLTYNAGTAVTLTAPATSGGNSFSSWTGCSSTSAATCAVTLNANTTVTANYAAPTTYTLTVNSTDPTSGVAIGVSPADNNSTSSGATSFTLTYNAGSAVTLTAPAVSGTNTFASWTGCAATNTTACTLTLSANTTVTANYTTPVTPPPPAYTLTVNSTNPASGVAIAASPADNNSTASGTTSFALNYTSGATVTLTAPATAASGADVFSSWTGCTSATALACTVSISANTTVTANYTAAPTFQGQVLSGGLPVSGAAIQVYAVGAAGNGSAATPMLTQAVTTNIAGQFTIAGGYTCGQSSTGSAITGSDQVYLVATGGTDSPTGTAANSAISMVAAIGVCTNLSPTSASANSAPPTLTVNEITTAAAAWALAPFTTSITSIGATTTNTLGITNAFLDAALLANPTTGAPTALPTGLVIETGKLNALADALAPCIDSAACTPLFTAATPTGGTPPADTFAAALNIVKNPGQNVAAVYAVIPATPSYATTLTQSPNDWTMSLTITDGGLASPTALGVDSLGNVWVANQDGPLSAFNPQGTPLSSTGYGGGNGHTISEVYGLAIDTSNNIWVTNTNGGPGTGGVTEFNGYGLTSTPSSSMGTVAGSYSTDISYPPAIAADTNGNIFVANTDPSAATVLGPSGSVVSADLGSSYNLSLIPEEIAVDSSHGFWLPGGETVAHVSAASTTYPNGQLLSNTTCCGFSTGVATDAQGNLWVADDLGGTTGRGAFAEIAADGTLTLSGVVTGGISYPTGVSVDAAQNVWFSNLYGHSITEIAGNGGSASAGTALSPTTGVYGTGGYGLDASLDEPTSILPDRSGNLWVSNESVYAVTMFFGLATPTVTPLQPVPTAP